MESLRPGETRFRIYGPDADDERPVSASHFANKLGVFVRALKAADRAANHGEMTHDYLISKLESSDPTVTLAEVPLQKFSDAAFIESGISAFRDCTNAILVGDLEEARNYGECPRYIRDLSGGARKTYGYAEVWTGEQDVVRIDEFLSEQSEAVIHPNKIRPISDGTNWFKGTIDASFDGTIKAVDLRGELPEVKLILTSGGKELDCVCKAEDKELIRATLDSRVRVYGRAFYDGTTGLPRRLEVREIESMSGDVDFSVWRGTFEQFVSPDWEDSDV